MKLHAIEPSHSSVFNSVLARDKLIEEPIESEKTTFKSNLALNCSELINQRIGHSFFR
jgi:hypothetical protein